MVSRVGLNEFQCLGHEYVLALHRETRQFHTLIESAITLLSKPLTLPIFGSSMVRCLSCRRKISGDKRETLIGNMCAKVKRALALSLYLSSVLSNKIRGKASWKVPLPNRKLIILSQCNVHIFLYYVVNAGHFNLVPFGFVCRRICCYFCSVVICVWTTINLCGMWENVYISLIITLYTFA